MAPKSERYRRRSRENAARAEGCTPEIAVLWREIADSYRFLAEREERIEADETQCMVPRPG